MVVLLLPLSDLLVDWLFATLAVVMKVQTPPPNLPSMCFVMWPAVVCLCCAFVVLWMLFL